MSVIDGCFEKTPQVWCITGNLGGGKSLTAVSMAIDGMRRGYYVVSNIFLRQDMLPYGGKLYKHIDFHYEEELPDGSFVDRFYDFHTLPRGTLRGKVGNKRVLVVLDEMAEWMDQYASVNKVEGLKRFFSWLRHSSKRGQDVILICQRRELLNKSARILVSRWVSCDDLATVRLPALRCHIPFMGDFCMFRIFDRLDNMIKRPQLVRKSVYGKFYETSQDLSGSGDSAIEYEMPESSEGKVTTFLPYLIYALSCFGLMSLTRFLH